MDWSARWLDNSPKFLMENLEYIIFVSVILGTLHHQYSIGFTLRFSVQIYCSLAEIGKILRSTSWLVRNLNDCELVCWRIVGESPGGTSMFIGGGKILNTLWNLVRLDCHVCRNDLTDCLSNGIHVTLGKWCWDCQWKPSALALLQSGTRCHLTVACLSSPAHSDEACWRPNF